MALTQTSSVPLSLFDAKLSHNKLYKIYVIVMLSLLLDCNVQRKIFFGQHKQPPILKQFQLIQQRTPSAVHSPSQFRMQIQMQSSH